MTIAVPSVWGVGNTGSLHAEDYGVRGDGGNYGPELQIAIDASVAQKRILELPPGRIKITQAIFLAYGDVTVTQAWLRGQGAASSAAFDGENYTGTVIDATELYDMPALIVQGGRHVVIENIAIFGPNGTYLWDQRADIMSATSVPSFNDTVGAEWVDPALLILNPDADSRYTPIAGIAIDPLTGAQPTPHYPATYGRNTTSKVSIRNVFILGFVAGVVISPNEDGNGDFVTIDNSGIYCCRYGFSIGNSQSRNAGVSNSQITLCHTQFTNSAHGAQIGKFGGPWTNISGGSCFQAFDISPVFGGNIVVTNYYCELLGRVGEVNGVSSLDKFIVFIGSQFNFTYYEGRGIFNTMLSIPSASPAVPVSFIKCVFLYIPDMVFFDGLLEFDECQFSTLNTPSTTVEYLFHNALAGGLGINWAYLGNLLPRVSNARYQRFNVDTGAYEAVPVAGRDSPCSRAYTPHIYAAGFLPRLAAYSSNRINSLPSFCNVTYTKFGPLAPTSVSLVNRTLTWTDPSWVLPYEISTIGPSPGDILMDDNTGTVFRCEAREGATVTFTMMNNYKLTAPATYEPYVALSLTLGSWHIYSSRVYITGYPQISSITATEKVLRNAGADSGNTAPITEVQVGDFMLVDQYKYYFVDPAQANVTAKDTVAHTIDLGTGGSGFFYTNSHIPMAPWVRFSVTPTVGRSGFPNPGRSNSLVAINSQQWVRRAT